MTTAVIDRPSPELVSVFAHVPTASTLPMHATRRRKLTFMSTLLAVPVAAGIATALRGPKTGVLAGGIAALALGALRWQMARWFSDTPVYEVTGHVGQLEMRRYPLLIEARAENIEALDFESALDRGFGRLACYVFGANSQREDIAMTTPVVTSMNDGRYQMSFVMPPGRPLATLPKPDDSRVVIAESPERRVAVLQFKGRFTREDIDAHERMLLKQVLEAGLVTRGSIFFASYDGPTTLPFLRRNELWIEIV